MGLVTQSVFAKLAGVTRQSVAAAIKCKSLVRNKNSKIDTEHELSQKYLIRCGVDDATGETKASYAEQKIKEEIGKIKADRQLREIKIEKEKDILIEKDRVARVLFGYLDALNTNLLDAPETMIDYITDKVKSGAKKGELVKYMRDAIGQEIKSTKKQIQKRLK